MIQLIQAGSLTIISGLPGSGKSKILRNISKEFIVSSDGIRENLMGHLFSFNKKVQKRRSEDRNEEVFEIVKSTLKARLKERLTTILDATNLSDKDRGAYIKMAKEYNVPAEVFIFDDVERALLQNKDREFIVPDEVMERMTKKFEPTSIYKHRIISADDTIEFVINEIDKDINLDVIGDVHGLYDEMISFMKELGYDEKGIHPENRKMLFLGDFVDRGLQSMEMIKLVKMLVLNGHYAIMGNHEEKLLANAKKYAKGDQPKGSFAVVQTFSALVKEKKYEELVSFIKSLPAYYVQGDYAFSHANMTYFNPMETPYSELVYGTYKDYSKRDADIEYDELFKDGINKYTLIRGHVVSSNEYRHVYSLERDQAFAGHLASLAIDKIKGSNFDGATTLYKVDFDFGKIKKTNQIFNKVVKDGFVLKKEYPLFTVFKYSKKVFHKNLWDESPLLLKARGIVLDFAGNVVVHPFDKIFNYLENDAGKDIPDDEIVVYVEKLNGFLGNISLNPYTKTLMYSTTGSLDSEFAKMIEEMVDRKSIGKLYKFFSQNDLTLSFEVIHPNDPHIIKYNEDEMGLKLIGARSKGFNDKSITEEELDVIAEELEFERPSYGRIDFGTLKDMVRDSNIEGYMVRKDNKEQDFIVKFKTPYYLITKFLGRMSLKNVRFMFGSPSKFKENIDEEFFGIVDSITSNLTLENFESMNEVEKMELVRGLIETERS